MKTNWHIEQFKKANPGQEVPINHGKNWTSIETRKLIDNVRRKKSIPEIAFDHGRTEGSIRHMLRDMAYEMYQRGDNIPDILCKTGLTEEELNDKIEKMQTVKSNPAKTIANTNVIEIQLTEPKPIQKAKAKLDDATYNELLADKYFIREMQSDIAEIKSDIKRIFELLKGLELA